MDTDKTPAASAEAQADADIAGGDAAYAPGAAATPDLGSDQPREINGPKGPEPTRYGDWEQKGRCSDF